MQGAPRGQHIYRIAFYLPMVVSLTVMFSEPLPATSRGRRTGQTDVTTARREKELGSQVPATTRRVRCHRHDLAQGLLPVALPAPSDHWEDAVHLARADLFRNPDTSRWKGVRVGADDD